MSLGIYNDHHHGLAFWIKDQEVGGPYQLWAHLGWYNWCRTGRHDCSGHRGSSAVGLMSLLLCLLFLKTVLWMFSKEETKWLVVRRRHISSEKMNFASQVLNKAVLRFTLKNLGKGMNPSLLSLIYIRLMDWLNDFNGMSTCLGLFYA